FISCYLIFSIIFSFLYDYSFIIFYSIGCLISFIIYSIIYYNEKNIIYDIEYIQNDILKISKQKQWYENNSGCNDENSCNEDIIYNNGCKYMITKYLMNSIYIWNNNFAPGKFMSITNDIGSLPNSKCNDLLIKKHINKKYLNDIIINNVNLYNIRTEYTYLIKYISNEEIISNLILYDYDNFKQILFVIFICKYFGYFISN
ncbi:MAG: hypothetical protein KIT69_19670, partial [Propionibacteriaceae bacterium]|nr:hypothetical protein [Propionibacteriaceae bacterium]